MEFYIINGKVNFNGTGEKYNVDDDFFEKYPNQINSYIFKEENGTLVGYDDNDFFDKKLMSEKCFLESCGYVVEIIDGVCVKTETEESKQYELKEKMKRAKKIKLTLANDLLSDTSALPELGEVEEERQAKITELETEYNAIIEDLSTYTAEERKCASSGLFDDVINSVF